MAVLGVADICHLFNSRFFNAQLRGKGSTIELETPRSMGARGILIPNRD